MVVDSGIGDRSLDPFVSVVVNAEQHVSWWAGKGGQAGSSLCSGGRGGTGPVEMEGGGGWEVRMCD